MNFQIWELEKSRTGILACRELSNRRSGAESKSMRYAFVIVVMAFGFSGVLVGRSASGESQNNSAKSAPELYAKHCASCHGSDGRAKTFKGKLKHARNLTDSEWQGNVSDERIFNSVMNGKGRMPGYGKKLSEQQIDSLVAYVRGLRK
jgi:mono/diheme cytochrome c family protein